MIWQLQRSGRWGKREIQVDESSSSPKDVEQFLLLLLIESYRYSLIFTIELYSIWNYFWPFEWSFWVKLYCLFNKKKSRGLKQIQDVGKIFASDIDPDPDHKQNLIKQTKTLTTIPKTGEATGSLVFVSGSFLSISGCARWLRLLHKLREYLQRLQWHCWGSSVGEGRLGRAAGWSGWCVKKHHETPWRWVVLWWEGWGWFLFMAALMSS